MRTRFPILRHSNDGTGATRPMRSTRTRSMLLAVGLLLSPLVFVACGGLSGNAAPPQKESADLDISIASDRDLNTDPKGRGAPVLLRVYELRTDVAFQDADFFALQNTDKAALGPDLLAVDQFIVRPGESRKILRKSHPETTSIGIFAAYRDLPNAVWRVSYKMPPAADASWYRAVIPANKAKLKIDLQANAILLTDEDAAARPVRHANETAKATDAGSTSAYRVKQAAPQLLEKPGIDALTVPAK
jgi:type VI secretion system protein VasD